MGRLYQDHIGGVLDSSLTDVATSMTSEALEATDVVTSPDTMILVLDPDGIGGAPEHVEVTTHTSAADTATITRGVNGTVARAHAAGIEWVHGLVASDFEDLLPFLFRGSGSPESSVTADVGSLYLRSDGGSSTTLYVKESGSGNTGWVAK